MFAFGDTRMRKFSALSKLSGEVTIKVRIKVYSNKCLLSKDIFSKIQSPQPSFFVALHYNFFAGSWSQRQVLLVRWRKNKFHSGCYRFAFSGCQGDSFSLRLAFKDLLSADPNRKREREAKVGWNPGGAAVHPAQKQAEKPSCTYSTRSLRQHTASH